MPPAWSRVIALCTLPGVALFLGAAQAADHPVVVGPGRALVVGNGEYPGENSLGGVPAQDARLVRGALDGLGYRVELQDDAWELTEFNTELASFVRKAKADGERLVFFYYSGHAVVIEGRSWLMPSQGPLPLPREQETLLQWAQRSLVDLDQVVLTLSQSGAQAIVVVLDACRTIQKDPREAFGPERRGPRDVGQGLAPVNLPSSQSNILTAYATLPGQTAANDGRYARALAEVVRGGRDVELSRLFKDVTGRFQQGQRGQLPQATFTGTADVCLAGTAEGCSRRAAPPPQPPVWSEQGVEGWGQSGATVGLRGGAYSAVATGGEETAEEALYLHFDLKFRRLGRPLGPLRGQLVFSVGELSLGLGWPEAGGLSPAMGLVWGQTGLNLGPSINRPGGAVLLGGGARLTPAQAEGVFEGHFAASFLQPSLGLALVAESPQGHLLELFLLDWGPFEGRDWRRRLDGVTGYSGSTPVDARLYLPLEACDSCGLSGQYRWARGQAYGQELDLQSLMLGWSVHFD